MGQAVDKLSVALAAKVSVKPYYRKIGGKLVKVGEYEREGGASGNLGALKPDPKKPAPKPAAKTAPKKSFSPADYRGDGTDLTDDDIKQAVEALTEFDPDRDEDTYEFVSEDLMPWTPYERLNPGEAEAAIRAWTGQGEVVERVYGENEDDESYAYVSKVKDSYYVINVTENMGLEDITMEKDRKKALDMLDSFGKYRESTGSVS